MTCKLEVLPYPPNPFPHLYTVSKSDSVVRRNETSSDIACGRTVVISSGVCLEPTTTGGSGDDDSNEIDETKTDYETYNGDDNEPSPPAGKTLHQALKGFVHVAVVCGSALFSFLHLFNRSMKHSYFCRLPDILYTLTFT